MTLGLPSDPAGAAFESDVEARGMVPRGGTTVRLFCDPTEAAPENAVEGRSVDPKMKVSASIATDSLHGVFMATPLRGVAWEFQTRAAEQATGAGISFPPRRGDEVLRGDHLR